MVLGMGWEAAVAHIHTPASSDFSASKSDSSWKISLLVCGSSSAVAHYYYITSLFILEPSCYFSGIQFKKKQYSLESDQIEPKIF